MNESQIKHFSRIAFYFFLSRIPDTNKSETNTQEMLDFHKIGRLCNGSENRFIETFWNFGGLISSKKA